MKNCRSNLLLTFIATLVVFFLLGSSNGEHLKVGFYKESCPDAESIVLSTVASFFSQDPTVSAPLLRLHFHDCFVRGCDGSVLLNSTNNSTLAEKDAKPNQSLDGYDVIDAAKEALEKACPGIVSCADIVALAARDAVTMAAGKSNNLWRVQTGRRDGVVSLASEALVNLPSPNANITQLKSQFGANGLSVKDLAILSGGHAIGVAHCPAFSRRLYNFTGKGDTDPTLDPDYAAQLRIKCPPGDVTTAVEMVPGSSITFDTEYYDLVTKRRGLFHSDQALLQDMESSAVVYSQSNSPGSGFFYEFGVSMVNMGKIGVLTGSAGEIRRKCALVN